VTGASITDIQHVLDEQGSRPDDLPAVPRYVRATASAGHLILRAHRAKRGSPIARLVEAVGRS
jgi:hypothetical protein